MAATTLTATELPGAPATGSHRPTSSSPSGTAHRLSSSSSHGSGAPRPPKFRHDAIPTNNCCANFLYNVPRAAVLVTLPGLIVLVIGAILVACVDRSEGWFEDDALISFIFMVVGGAWTLGGLLFWLINWLKNRPRGPPPPRVTSQQSPPDVLMTSSGWPMTSLNDGTMASLDILEEESEGVSTELSDVLVASKNGRLTSSGGTMTSLVGTMASLDIPETLEGISAELAGVPVAVMTSKSGDLRLSGGGTALENGLLTSNKGLASSGIGFVTSVDKQLESESVALEEEHIKNEKKELEAAMSMGGPMTSVSETVIQMDEMTSVSGFMIPMSEPISYGELMALEMEELRRRHAVEEGAHSLGRSTTPNVDAHTLNMDAHTLNVDAPTLNVNAPTLNVDAPTLNVDAPTLNVDKEDKEQKTYM